MAAGAIQRRTGLTGRRFGLLLRKELTSLEGLFPVLLGVTLLWELFLVTRRPTWGPGAVAGLSLIPLGLIPFWAMWAGFQSVRAGVERGSRPAPPYPARPLLAGAGGEAPGHLASGRAH